MWDGPDRLHRGFKDRGCEFVSITEAIDTSSAGHKLVFHVLSTLAEFGRR